MLNLVSREAEAAGAPLNDSEKKVLAEEFTPGRIIATELRERINYLLGRILEREKGSSIAENEKSFGAALEWVEPEYPNVAAFAEQLITKGGFGALPPKLGKAWIKDRAQLVGCAMALVLVLAAIAIALSFLFDRK